MGDQQKTSANHTPVTHLIDDEDASNAADQPISTTISSKEGEPIAKTQEIDRSHEVRFTETEPQIEDKEVEKFVEVKQEDISIHPDLQKAGLESLDSSSLDPKHKVQLPISDEKVIEGLQKPVTSSFRWLAEVALFMLKQAHLTLKTVHGKVVRVMKR